MILNMTGIPVCFEGLQDVDTYEISFYSEIDFLKMFAAVWLQNGKDAAIATFMLDDAIAKVIEKQELLTSYCLQNDLNFLHVMQIVTHPSVKACLLNAYAERKRKISSIEQLSNSRVNLMLQSCIVSKIILSEHDAAELNTSMQVSDADSITMQYYRLKFLGDAEDAIAILQALSAANQPDFHTALSIIQETETLSESAFYALLLLFYRNECSYIDLIQEGNKNYGI